MTAIGVFSTAKLAFFDWDKQYRRIPVEEQTEIASLVGDIGAAMGRPWPAICWKAM